MGIFNKKNKTTEIEVSIRKVADGDGEKYMHIGDFVSLLEEYKIFSDEKNVITISNFISELITQLKSA